MQYLNALGSLKYKSDDGSVTEAAVDYVSQSGKFLEIYTINYSKCIYDKYTYDTVNNRWYKFVIDIEKGLGEEIPCKEGEIVSFSYTYRWE